MCFCSLGTDGCDHYGPSHWQPLSPALLATGLLWLNFSSLHSVCQLPLKALTLEGPQCSRVTALQLVEG